MAVLGKICLKTLEAIFLIDMTFSCTTGLSRHQKSVKNQKRSTKVNNGHKGHFKGHGARICKFDNFFMFWGPFGV